MTAAPLPNSGPFQRSGDLPAPAGAGPEWGEKAGLGYRNGMDRLQDAGDDLVRIGFGIRTPVFQVALITVLDEVNGQADGSAAIRQAVAELIDGLGFMQAGQAQVVVGTIDGDVRRDIVLERAHQSFE